MTDLWPDPGTAVRVTEDHLTRLVGQERELTIPQGTEGVALSHVREWYHVSVQFVIDGPPFEAWVTPDVLELVEERPTVPAPDHECSEHAVPYTSDGPLGHGWECGICGAFLQAG